MTNEDSIAALVDLGFNRVDAEVYAFLVAHSPATGYRIAQGIGKPVGSVYKAVESLANMGAVVLENGSVRQCRAVPADEMLAQVSRRFSQRHTRATDTLSRIPPAGTDDRVYELRSAEQVLERCREMLGRSEEMVLVDAFPPILSEIMPEIEQALGRAVGVALLVYAPTELEGATIIRKTNCESILENWSGQWLYVVVDGREMLQAFFSSDGKQIRQAIWSGSSYLSWLCHCGSSGEMTASLLTNAIKNGASRKELLALVDGDDRLLARLPAGYLELIRRFGDANGGDETKTEKENRDDNRIT